MERGKTAEQMKEHTEKTQRTENGKKAMEKEKVPQNEMQIVEPKEEKEETPQNNEQSVESKEKEAEM